MATWFFHEETLDPDETGGMKLVRYYFDDISSEVITRSFRLFPAHAQTEFIDNERIPFADLRPDVKRRLLEYMVQRERSNLKLAS
jgi:hypothetical protein